MTKDCSESFLERLIASLPKINSMDYVSQVKIHRDVFQAKEHSFLAIHLSRLRYLEWCTRLVVSNVVFICEDNWMLLITFVYSVYVNYLCSHFTRKIVVESYQSKFLKCLQLLASSICTDRLWQMKSIHQLIVTDIKGWEGYSAEYSRILFHQIISVHIGWMSTR